MTEVKVRDVVRRALRKDADFPIPDDSIVEKLGLDSIQAMEILIWIEDEFAIVIEDEALSPELVDSIAAMVRYIEARTTP